MFFCGEFPSPQNHAGLDLSILEMLKTLLMAHEIFDSGMDSTGRCNTEVIEHIKKIIIVFPQ